MLQKAFPIEVKEFDVETGVFEGYANVFEVVDRVGDRVKKGAFKRSLNHWRKKGRPIPILWQHLPHEPIGYTLEAEEDEHGLKVKGQLLMGVQRAREAYELIKADVLGGMSIGYDVVKDDWTDDGIRELKEIKLFEWSLVTWPANEASVVTGVKSDRDFETMLIELTGAATVARLQEKAGRVLSDRNRGLVQSAQDALSALLAAASESEGDPAESHSPSDSAPKGLGGHDATDLGDPDLIHSLKGLMDEMRRSAGIDS